MSASMAKLLRLPTLANSSIIPNTMRTLTASSTPLHLSALAIYILYSLNSLIHTLPLVPPIPRPTSNYSLYSRLPLPSPSLQHHYLNLPAASFYHILLKLLQLHMLYQCPSDRPLNYPHPASALGRNAQQRPYPSPLPQTTPLLTHSISLLHPTLLNLPPHPKPLPLLTSARPAHFPLRAPVNAFVTATKDL